MNNVKLYLTVLSIFAMAGCNSGTPRRDGMTGPAGANGEPGSTGAAGAAGSDGYSALIEVHRDLHNCRRDGITIVTSVDTNRNGVADLQDLNFSAVDICAHDERRKGR